MKNFTFLGTFTFQTEEKIEWNHPPRKDQISNGKKATREGFKRVRISKVEPPLPPQGEKRRGKNGVTTSNIALLVSDLEDNKSPIKGMMKHLSNRGSKQPSNS
uniref:Uncharacterized protein n=1 Tax=Cucumis melo TaxID=3656 RepID=A0A9I9E4U9_CUCME